MEKGLNSSGLEALYLLTYTKLEQIFGAIEEWFVYSLINMEFVRPSRRRKRRNGVVYEALTLRLFDTVSSGAFQG